MAICGFPIDEIEQESRLLTMTYANAKGRRARVSALSELSALIITGSLSNVH